MRKLTDYKVMPIFPMAPVSDPRVSPDGGRVLFTYTTVSMKDDKYDGHIWLHELRTKKTRQFTHGRSNESNPRWSPKGIGYCSHPTARARKSVI